MTLDELIDWLDDLDVDLSDAQIVKISDAITKKFTKKATSEVEVPPYLERVGGYVKLNLPEGESWVSVEHISNVRHVSYVELHLSSGDVLTIDVTAQELLEFLSVLSSR